MKHKKLFTAMLVAMASTYGVESVAEQFEIVPSVGQRLQDKITESDSFLQLINVMGVSELKGEKIIGGIAGFVPKRTNTEAGDRQTKDVLNLANSEYELHSTEFDTHIKYGTIDAWAKFPDFKERYAGYVRKAIALARIRVGWYGLEAAAVTDGDANPNGEDVNKGWFQHLREFNEGAQWLSRGAAMDGETPLDEIRIGAGGDFENLDAAVHACKQMIDPVHREAGDLVVMIGTDLLDMDKAQLYAAQGQKPTEKERIENQAITRTYGGLPAMTPTGFPARGLMITSVTNLSIYYQDTGLRRQVVNNPKRNRVEDYNSSNEGYVIEDETKAAGFEFEHIVFPDGEGGWE